MDILNAHFSNIDDAHAENIKISIYWISLPTFYIKVTLKHLKDREIERRLDINFKPDTIMKKVLLFLCLSLFIFSCKKDSEPDAELKLDRGSNAAPFLLAGEYIAAVRFPTSELSDFQGRKLESIEYYLQNTPTQCEVRVYSGSNGNVPDNLIYSESVTVDMEANSWNVHTIPNAINIDGDDLWIGVRIVLSAEDATIGCDVGPAVTNGDWFLSDANNTWTTYRDFTSPQVSINWNIRGKLSE